MPLSGVKKSLQYRLPRDCLLEGSSLLRIGFAKTFCLEISFLQGCCFLSVSFRDFMPCENFSVISMEVNSYEKY